VNAHISSRRISNALVIIIGTNAKAGGGTIRVQYRFTVSGPKNRQLPGKPDIVLPKYKAVIFVHGCFWHRHKGCKGATTPKTRTEWWQEKFDRNVANDKKNTRALRKQDWQVLTTWEC
jgi:DNA mismatch endonuclease (patch repair protein)